MPRERHPTIGRARNRVIRRCHGDVQGRRRSPIAASARRGPNQLVATAPSLKSSRAARPPLSFLVRAGAPKLEARYAQVAAGVDQHGPTSLACTRAEAGPCSASSKARSTAMPFQSRPDPSHASLSLRSAEPSRSQSRGPVPLLDVEEPSALLRPRLRRAVKTWTVSGET